MAERRLWNKKLFREGEIVFKEGDQGNSAFLVEYGTIEVSKTVDGEKVSLATLRQGEMFGEMALIDDDVRMASAKAVDGAAELLVVSREMFQKKMDNLDPFTRGLIKILADNVRNAQK